MRIHKNIWNVVMTNNIIELKKNVICVIKIISSIFESIFCIQTQFFYKESFLI